MQVKSDVLARYQKIKGLNKERDDLQKSGRDPKGVVILSQKIRDEFKALNTEFTNLANIMKAEAKKGKKSKLTAEDVEHRQNILLDLKQKVEELSLATSTSRAGGGGGYVPRDDGGFAPMSFNNFVADKGEEEEDNKFGGPSGVGPYGASSSKRETELTDMERNGLQLIQSNRAEQDKLLDIIGNVVGDLKEMAIGIKDEADKQAHLLDDIEKKTEKVSDKMDATNKNLKKTAAENNRGGDKLCMDMICLILLLGVATVIYNIIKRSTTK
jgi:SYP7 family syntaxin